MTRWRDWALLLLLLNTAYLTAFDSPTIFYFANVVAHILLGCALAVPYGRHAFRQRRQWPWLVLVAATVVAAGAIFGVAITLVGAYGPYRWLLPAHIGLMLGGGVPLL